eukprot:s2715_g8.t1
MSPLAPLMAAAPAGSRFSSSFPELVHELRKVGPQKLMVITDFDQTLTSYFGKDGSPGDQCHDIILRHLDLGQLPEEAQRSFVALEEWNSMSDAQRLARCDNDWTKKVAASVASFDTFHALSAQHQLSRFAESCVAKSNVRVRDGMKDTFGWLERWDVPMLVVSAGLDELLTSILQSSGAPLPRKAKVLANSLDEAAVSVTSSHKAHALELVPDFMSEVTSEGRTHVLLLGDKPSDCCPLQGLPKSTPALKIGFLAEPTEEKFQEYLNVFDAVLVSDATMDFVNCAVLTQELERQLSPSELLFCYGRSLPEDFVATLEVKACIENAPAQLQQLPGARPGRLPGDLLLQGTLRPWARYEEEDGTRLDDLKAMIDENFLSAALILAKEQLEVGDFVNLTGRRKLRCLEELLRLLRSCRGEFATSLKEDSKQLASTQGCRRLALQHRVSSKRALRLVIEEVKEAVARAEDGGGLPFAFSGRK